ncbi:hypothetical protein AGABI2DRAFT_137063 [Agaricus bisporus var. bisporus H97]|uniref:hypothetical protein n=1 Tax=Agaricus bisporus var. bisporus (strain H97 / ATCC MYA-4626 / FGSC 10389) TaxID=936046 RepID=UPI00029F6C1C|nr:hypothetical protein AGABI2DRAFT_137063 [Agaricus bisporus var. bisporus H97]EKV45537.1 hypothetical protein AGABI2DRAFT_137063 [Agaricus bisporus var. bisporus H97]
MILRKSPFCFLNGLSIFKSLSLLLSLGIKLRRRRRKRVIKKILVKKHEVLVRVVGRRQ